jgi:hypothetical protein
VSLSEGTVIKIAASLLLADESIAQQIFWFVLEDAIASGPLDEADVLDAVANWVDQIYTHVIPNINDAVIPGIVDVWEVNVPTGDLTPIGDTIQTWTPTQGADQLPNGVAAIIQLKTTNTDVTGRKFVPGLAESSIEDNNWGSATMTNLASFAAEWPEIYDDPNDVELVPGVYSNTFNNFFLATGTVIVNGIAGYQRRRKPGVGI